MRKKRILSEEHKRKIADAIRGRKVKFSDEAIENIRIAAAKRKGIKKGPRSQEVIEKIRASTLGKKKTITKENPAWFKKGHIPETAYKKGHVPWIKGRVWGICRSSFIGKYKVWRNQVLDRDSRKCLRCFSEKKLHAHHIIPWKVDESKRFEVDNGMTLCASCHMKEENTGIENGKRTRFKKGHKGFR